jgi:hypothetical protein
MVGLERAGWWIVRAMRLGFWAECQSQFWARRLLLEVEVLEVVVVEEVLEVLPVSQERAVQPSLKRPKAISVRTLRARMSYRDTWAPCAIPEIEGFCQLHRFDIVVVVVVVVVVSCFAAYSPSISSRYAGQFLRIEGSKDIASSRTSCQFFLAVFRNRSA